LYQGVPEQKRLNTIGLDHIKNDGAGKKLKIQSVQYNEHKQNWINHLDIITDERVPKPILKYKPEGCKDRGRPWKRCKIRKRCHCLYREVKMNKKDEEEEEKNDIRIMKKRLLCSPC
jgi:hypothetical protein